jgi:hypothetical protein
VPDNHTLCKEKRKGAVKMGHRSRDVEITLVDVGDVGERIQVFNGRRIRVVDGDTILSIRNAQDCFWRAAVGKFHNRIIEFLPTDEVNGWAIFERFLGKHRHMRTNKSNPDIWISLLDSVG